MSLWHLRVAALVAGVLYPLAAVYRARRYERSKFRSK